jgi:gamma-glutamyltranspeptidase/glutathione hydrolase
MTTSPQSVRGTTAMAVAPHALAADSALAVLREGGDAVEAMVAAAATIAVVYPHMNGLGGDGFWLIGAPDRDVIGIDACGGAASAATVDLYRERGLDGIPTRGPLAANTVAGTVSGWQAALEWSSEHLGSSLPLSRLVQDAVDHAERGVPVTTSQASATAAKRDELVDVPGFAATYLPGGAPPAAGDRFVQAQLGTTLRRLAEAGLDDFYRGELAASMARDLAAAGSPVTSEDLARHTASLRTPLSLQHSLGTVYNMPPPTQGVVSLQILGLLDRLLGPGTDPDDPAFVHLAVEATKQAFSVRDRYVTDPAFSDVDFQALLRPEALDEMASGVDPSAAAPWGAGRGPADTVWMGVVDARGVAVSFIQSVYHEFGSGVVLPGTGITWQNRGASFSLDDGALNRLEPRRKPFHTLNPAMARLDDGRVLVYGSMGGDGQPQSQSAVFSRVTAFGMGPQAAVSAPRWLLGRTWGDTTDTLKLESRFAPSTVDALVALGHDVEMVGEYDETMGHAGAIVRHPDGSLEGGADPRSDGGVAAW